MLNIQTTTCHAECGGTSFIASIFFYHNSLLSLIGPSETYPDSKLSQPFLHNYFRLSRENVNLGDLPAKRNAQQASLAKTGPMKPDFGEKNDQYSKCSAGWSSFIKQADLASGSFCPPGLYVATPRDYRLCRLLRTDSGHTSIGHH